MLSYLDLKLFHQNYLFISFCGVTFMLQHIGQHVKALQSIFSASNYAGILLIKNNNNNNHELCSAPFTIKPTDQWCITVKVLSQHTQHN